MTAPLSTDGAQPVPLGELPEPRHSADVPVLVRRTCDLLQSRVPLTLLLDLAEPYGPDSVERFTAEGGDTAWIHPA